jgi:hypothetical protein
MLDNPVSYIGSHPTPNLFSTLKILNVNSSLNVLVVSSWPVSVKKGRWRGLFLPILVGPVYISPVLIGLLQGFSRRNR